MSKGLALCAILACALTTAEVDAQTLPATDFHSVGRGVPMLEALPSRSDLPAGQPDLSNYLSNGRPSWAHSAQNARHRQAVRCSA